MSFTKLSRQRANILPPHAFTTHLWLFGLCSLTACLVFSSASIAHEGDNQESQESSLSGQRIITGTVEEVRGEQAMVNTGELQPRYLPMNLREEKGLPDLKKGDRVEITVNDQNLIVDVHLAGEESTHRIVHGTLAQPLVTGHEKAVIQPKEGKEESHKISSQAMSKVASIPVGAEAAFLIDEMDQIVDVTFESQEKVDQAQQGEKKKTPLKGNFKKVTGTLKQSLKGNSISIQQDGKKEQRYEVRPLVQARFKDLSSGQHVILFVDDEDKVTDVAFIEQK